MHWIPTALSKYKRARGQWVDTQRPRANQNGSIDVTRREGSRSCFEVYLPATREEIQAPSRHPVLEDCIGDETILVVDDVAERRENARRRLSRLGYGIVTVASGEEAVGCLKDCRIDLVVLDMIMTIGIDGRDTYRRIIEDQPGQRAVIASGFSENEREAEPHSLGAGEYLRKPYTLERIGLAVRREIDRP